MRLRLKKRNRGHSTLLEKYLTYKKDVVKFVEDCVQIKSHPWSNKSENIKLDYIQEKILRSFKKDHYLQLLCTRQAGTSTNLKILISHVLTFFEHSRIGLISSNRNFVRDVQKILDNIPTPIFPGYVIKSNDRIILKNSSDLLVSYNPNPHTSFLGNSIDILIVDNAAYIKNLEEVMTALMTMLITVHRLSKERKKPYGIIIASAPNEYNKDNYFQKLWESLNKDNSLYKPIEVYWKRITRLREDPNWYNEACKNLNYDKKKIDRELNLKFV